MRKEISEYFKGKRTKRRIFLLAIFLLLFVVVNGVFVYTINPGNYYFYVAKKVIPYPAFVFGNKMVTVSDYEYEVNLNKKIYESAYRIDFSLKGDGGENIKSLRENVRSDIFDRIVMSDYLSKAGKSVTSKEVREEYEKMVRDIGGDKEIRDILRYSSNINEREIKSKIYSNLLKDRFRESIAYAAKIKAVLIKPSSVDGEPDWEEASSRAQSILEEIRSNINEFDRYYILFNENSDSIVKSLSGEEYIDKEEVPESMRSAFYSLGVGDVSDLLKNDSGFYIIKKESERGFYRGTVEEFLEEQKKDIRVWSFIR